MLIPKKNNWDMFDDFFETSKFMKTDIKENDDSYELIIDLPGFKKENINLSLENGYLEINAKNSFDKDESGKFIRKERYSGEFSRSFYLGENIKEDLIKASYKDGLLIVSFPKLENLVSDKKYIQIEDL